jgi:ATP-binding cassette subfamily B protein
MTPRPSPTSPKTDIQDLSRRGRAEAPNERGLPLSNGAIVRRLLGITWRYRGGCVRIILIQLLLLAMGVCGLSFTGVAIDYMRSRAHGPPAGPFRAFGFPVPPSAPPVEVIGVLAVLILSLALLRAALNYLYAVQVNKLVEQSFTIDLRGELYDHLQQLSFRFFDANTTGSIIARATGDVQSVRMFVDQVMVQSLIMLISVTVYITYMVSLSLTLAVACLATAPVLCLLATGFSRRIQPEYARNRALVDRMIHLLAETVKGIAVIKGFGCESGTRRKLERANDEVLTQQYHIFWKVSLFTPTAWFLSRINTIVLLSYGGWLVLNRDFPLGSGLVVFAGLLDQFAVQVNSVATIANSAQQSLIGARRVFEILDTPLEVQNRPGAARCDRFRGDVAFERVAFGFGREDAVLRDIDLRVLQGQCVAILGATGAGKSLLLSLVPRFFDATAGRILVDGRDVRSIHLDDLRRNIGVVFQENFLFSNTVAANIAFGHPEASQAEIESAARLARAHDFILALPRGYDTVLAEGGSSLSGGQRQRLAIARAVIKQPAILLLDDPTAAIDSETEHEIYEALERAIEGRTTFIVAHKISTLRRADFVIVMENGRIVQRGTHEELVRVPGPYLRVAHQQLVDGSELESLALEGTVP